MGHFGIKAVLLSAVLAFALAGPAVAKDKAQSSAALPGQKAEPAEKESLIDRWRAMSLPEKRAFREQRRQEFLQLPPDEQRRMLLEMQEDQARAQTMAAAEREKRRKSH